MKKEQVRTSPQCIAEIALYVFKVSTLYKSSRQDKGDSIQGQVQYMIGELEFHITNSFVEM